MKKYFIILLLLVYGLSSTGMSVHLHYCCGQLDDITFSAVHQYGCSKDSEDKPGPCCNSKQIELKLKADQEPAAQWVQSAKEIKAPAPEAGPVVFFIKQPVPVIEQATGPPPVPLSLPLFIQNCVFRI